MKLILAIIFFSFSSFLFKTLIDQSEGLTSLMGVPVFLPDWLTYLRQRGRPGSFLRCLLHLRQLERRNRRSRIGNVIFQKPFLQTFLRHFTAGFEPL